MNKQNITVGLLSVSAAALLCACFLVTPARQARGDFSIKDRDYQMATVPVQQGGDALFITDNRTDQIAVFAWDNNTRSVQLRCKGPITNLFPPQ